MPTYQSYALPAVSAAGGVPQTGGTLVQCNNPPQNLPATPGGKFVGCASAAPQNDNWLDELIGPGYIDYPLWRADDYSTPTPQPAPPATTGGTPSPTLTSGGSSSPAAPSQPVAMLQMPGMAQPVPVMLMATVATVPQSSPPASSGGSSSSSSGSSPPSNPSTPPSPTSTPSNSAQPTAEMATMPVLAPPVVRTFSTNPAFPPVMQPLKQQQQHRLGPPRVRHVKHQGKGEAIEVDATPIQLKVPPNCNAMEVTLGAIEPLAGGAEGDMSNLLDAGKQAITDVNGTELDETNLSPGDTVFLHLPWRAPANAKVAAGVARRAVKVEFYKNVEYWQPQAS